MTTEKVLENLRYKFEDQAVALNDASVGFGELVKALNDDPAVEYDPVFARLAVDYLLKGLGHAIDGIADGTPTKPEFSVGSVCE